MKRSLDQRLLSLARITVTVYILLAAAITAHFIYAAPRDSTNELCRSVEALKAATRAQAPEYAARLRPRKCGRAL